MKINRLILLLICNFYMLTLTNAQTIKGYAVTKVMSSMGSQAVPTLAIVIEYYDGYLLLNGVEKFVYRTKNYDGSMQYYPEQYGNLALRTTGILVSSDYSIVRQFTQSSFMNMTMELVYDYSFIGDGYEAAQNYMNLFSDGYSESGNTRDWSNCSSCMGTGRCKYCDGSGQDEYARNGRCGVCRGLGKCVGCDGKGGFR